MKKNERVEKIEKLRGEFIGKMVFIEILLNQIISNYITSDKQKYVEFMLNKLDIPRKIEIYKQIKKDKEPSFIKYSYNGLEEDIKEMQDVRNLFAHSWAEIGFLGYRDTKPIYSNRIEFRNSKNMERDFFEKEANSFDLDEIRNHLVKLDKIKDSLFDVMHYYNKSINTGEPPIKINETTS